MGIVNVQTNILLCPKIKPVHLQCTIIIYLTNAYPMRPCKGPIYFELQWLMILVNFFHTFVEKNSKGATPWNVKTATYSYNSPEMATKRPIGSPPTNEITSPPTAKRRGNAAIFDMVRPTNEQKTAAHFTTHTGGTSSA